MLKKHLPLLLILLLAFLLRIYNLTGIPPGLTHDEANHGWEAIGILDGVYRYFFPLNYGSEPLYSYIVASSMAVFGKNLFALRLVNVIFGVAAIGATHFWVSTVFDKRIAGLTAVLTAVSFWPLASSREALRAGMLPFFMVVAVSLFWRLVFGKKGLETGDWRFATRLPRQSPWLIFAFALAIVATLHIYLAARVAWLLFPAFLLYLWLTQRGKSRGKWQAPTLGLLLAGLLSVPMFVYLSNHPEAQSRISMLDGTIQQLLSGDFAPVWGRASEALWAFVWPGYGDQFLAYNIPGRPVLDAATAVFFIIGIGLSLWRWKRPSYAFVLLWFVIGIIPSLLTGATANTTRNLAALPVVYLLPALGFVGLFDWLRTAINRGAGIIVATIWLTFVGFTTARDYFLIWGQSPEVRGAYQHTLVEELAYLEAHGVGGETAVLISTVYPGPAHDSSISRVLTNQANTRWADARFGLIVPHNQTIQAMIPASTPPHPAFTPFLIPQKTINLRPDDLDPSFTHYTLDVAKLNQTWELDTARPLANFSGAIELLQARWLQPVTKPGETAELLTIWRVADPTRLGQRHPPAYATELTLFTHVVDQDGNILTQQDRLDAPSWSWQTGDLILQIHTLPVPADTQPASYATAIGIYDPITTERLPTVDGNGNPTDSQQPINPLKIGD